MSKIRLGALPLRSVPATAAASTGTAVRLILHEPALAWGMAGLVGLLALLGVFAVSAEAQATMRLWIRHRAEHRLAAVESFEIRRRIRAATSGRRWTQASATKIRQDAAECERPTTSLTEVMRITRSNNPAAVELESGICDQRALPLSGGDAVEWGPLEVVPPHEPTGDRD